MAEAPAKGSAAKHPGERLASYFENFFTTVAAVATLGASITFAKEVQAPVAPFHDYGFSTTDVQYLIAISWLFFVLALAFTSFFASALSLWRPQAVEAFGTQNGSERRKVLWYATAVSAFLFALAVVAFITISLVVVAYAGPVGWIALVFMCIFAVLGFGSIIWQSPLEWPTSLVKFEREEQEAFERHMGLHVPDRKQMHDGIDSDSLPTMPRHRSLHRLPQPDEKDGYHDYRPQPAKKESGYDYGRSTSGEYAGGGGNWRQIKRDDGYDLNRYSKGSSVVSDAYEPGIFVQGGLVYDDGVREGLVTSRYAH